MKKFKNFLSVFFLSLTSLIMLLPLFWMIIMALKKPEELTYYPVTFFPAVAQWKHFQQIICTNEVLDFLISLRNSFTVSISITAIVTLSSAFAGFGFARYHARGKNFFFGVVLATMMLPQLVTLIPQYIMFSQLGILNKPWPFCYLPFWINALPGWGIFIFLFRQFYAGLSKELEDAALIDGCGRLQTFWKIFFPLSVPAIITTCIFTFQWTYADYLTPLLYLTSDNQTLAVQMMNVHMPDVKYTLPIPPAPYQMAVGVLYTLPLILLFFMAQRHFVRGISTSGVKG
jgi:ABC-type sugar transport system, permease component